MTRYSLALFFRPRAQNVRPDYLKEIWKVVNWKDVGARLAAAKSS